MSEMIQSAIVGEAVSRIVSSIASPDEAGNIERLEMAQIKMEAAIETSSKWQIADMSLLRWRKKLKRVAQECDGVLRECKQRALEDEEIKEQVKQSSFPRRIAHATKSFVSSLIGPNIHECSSKDVVERFERLANGANDFLRYVQLGGTPRLYMFFDPLIRNLFEGKFVQYRALHHGSQYHCFGIRPMTFEERGLEAMLSYVYEDCKAPHSNFRLRFMLRLSESTDIIGITIKCLQLVTPHFKSTAEVVIKELTQLPTQDFSWSSSSQYDPYGGSEHWNNVHTTLTRWFRPDPLCCKGYDHIMPASGGSTDSSTLSNIFPEPVCEVFLQRHISLSEYKNLHGGSSTRCSSSSDSQEGFPPLKLGVLFMPHDSVSVDDLESAIGAENSAVEAIDGEKLQKTHVDVHPHQLDEMLLPKAIDHLYSNPGLTTYQISWMSRHGSAHLCVEKLGTQMLRTRRVTRRSSRGGTTKVLRMQDKMKKEKEQWKQVSRDFLKLLPVRVSDPLFFNMGRCVDYLSG